MFKYCHRLWPDMEKKWDLQILDPEQHLRKPSNCLELTLYSFDSTIFWHSIYLHPSKKCPNFVDAIPFLTQLFRNTLGYHPLLSCWTLLNPWIYAMYVLMCYLSKLLLGSSRLQNFRSHPAFHPILKCQFYTMFCWSERRCADGVWQP